MGSARFTAALVPRGQAAAVVLDDEQVAAVGERGQAYARWIDDAKRDETRHRRVAQALEMLREGKTRS
jgi:uncharacterized protein YdeI (YjbR/CyaY-like superfamily)